MKLLILRHRLLNKIIKGFLCERGQSVGQWLHHNIVIAAVYWSGVVAAAALLAPDLLKTIRSLCPFLAKLIHPYTKLSRIKTNLFGYFRRNNVAFHDSCRRTLDKKQEVTSQAIFLGTGSGLLICLRYRFTLSFWESFIISLYIFFLFKLSSLTNICHGLFIVRLTM